jgi:hypothetical protein
MAHVIQDDKNNVNHYSFQLLLKSIFIQSKWREVGAGHRADFLSDQAVGNKAGKHDKNRQNEAQQDEK